MTNNSVIKNLSKIFLYFLLIILGIANYFNAFYGSVFNNEFFYYLGIFILVISTFYLFISPSKAILLLPISCVLIPEFELFGYKIIFLDLVYIILLFYVLFNKFNLSFNFRIKSKLFGIGSFIFLIFLFSTIQEMLRTTQYMTPILFFLKYVEYSTFYLIVLSYLENKDISVKRFEFAIILYAYCISFYGIYSLNIYPRATAPFEGVNYEPNTMACMTLFIIPVLIGFIIENQNGLLCRIFLLFVTIQSFVVFIFTLSRTGYIACFGMIIAALFFIKKVSNRVLYLFFIVYIAVFCIPDSVYLRFNTILDGSGKFLFNLPFVGSTVLNTSDSAIIRLEKYDYILNKVFPFVKIFGRGINGVGFVDGLYIKFLGELGLFGILFLFIILKSVWPKASKDKQNYNDIIIGNSFKIGFIGLLIFSLFANTFILYRVLSPFICIMIYLKIREKNKLRIC